MVDTGEDCGLATLKEGHSWVFWFGDYIVSQVLLWKMVRFGEEFADKFTTHSSRS